MSHSAPATLTSIEREQAALIRSAALTHRRVYPVRTALLAFAITPFVIVELIFIPILGQVLVALAVITSGYYLWLVRSIWTTVLAAVGCALSAAVWAGLCEFLIKKGDLALYLALGIGTATMIAYILMVAGASLAHLERGRAALQSAAPAEEV